MSSITTEANSIMVCVVADLLELLALIFGFDLGCDLLKTEHLQN